MGWNDGIAALTADSLRTLSTWALVTHGVLDGESHLLEPAIPEAVLERGAPAVVRYAVERLGERPGAQFWALLLEGPTQDPAAARGLGDQLAKGMDWRQGFAAGVMIALAGHGAPDDFGVFQGLETARATLGSLETLAQLSPAVGLEAPLPMSASPFSSAVVQEALDCLDSIVTYQHTLPEWPAVLQHDLQRFPESVQRIVVSARRANPASPFLPLASQLVQGLRAAMEWMLVSQQVNAVGATDRTLKLVACRYASNRDVILAFHRTAATNAEVFADQSTQLVVAQYLENLLAAAYWLRDDDAQAAIHHGIGLLLRRFVRKAPGLLDAITHMERAITIRRARAEHVAAWGAQIDLTPILIQYGGLLSMIVDQPTTDIDWERDAEAHLRAAIDGLSQQENDRVARAYLGEAFHNLARLHQVGGAAASAVAAARAALDVAGEVDNKDLEARASLILSQVNPNAAAAADYAAAAATLVNDVRREMADDHVAVSWIGNKQGAFASQIDFLLGEAGKSLDEERACDLLLVALEQGRGLTYNRWLGVDNAFDVGRLQEAVDLAPDTVLAVYAVGLRRAAVILVAAGVSRQLRMLNLLPDQIEELTAAHTSGLKRQGDVRCLPLWKALQARFQAEGAALVKPLEDAARAGKTLCIVPHRALHAIGFHTLSGDASVPALGLRTPVITNPSVTNWMVCKGRSLTSLRACLSIAAPVLEAEHFAGLAAVRKPIESAGFDVTAFDGTSGDLGALSEPWGLLHLVCHGLFREPHSQYGLLLPAGGTPPPSAAGDLQNARIGEHLATPARLREYRIAGQLTFLSSCLSARNQNLPGDDLMGITRAIFASGAASLIAGAWTVNTRYVPPFAEAFYAELRSAGTAGAVLRARQAVASITPDPFFWGAFVHQGADVRYK